MLAFQVKVEPERKFIFLKDKKREIYKISKKDNALYKKVSGSFEPVESLNIKLLQSDIYVLPELTLNEKELLVSFQNLFLEHNLMVQKTKNNEIYIGYNALSWTRYAFSFSILATIRLNNNFQGLEFDKFYTFDALGIKN